MTERTNEAAVVCTLAGECCWDSREDGPACWSPGACGCKVVAHSPAIHPPAHPNPEPPTGDGEREGVGRRDGETLD